MSLTILLPPEKSRLRALLDHFSVVEDPREPWRVAHAGSAAAGGLRHDCRLRL
jgi:hypothetical protein